MVTIDGKNFKTKKAAYEFVKEKIYTIGECEIRKHTPNAHEFEFFTQLVKFKLHDETVNIKTFILFKTIRTGSTIHLKVLFKDGTEKLISWRDCSRRTHTKKNSIDEAMRNAIAPHAHQYRLDNYISLKCVLCESIENPQVDHINSFYNIKNAFFENNKITHPTRFDTNMFGSSVFKPDDIEFESLWVKHHNSTAKYQILCRNCNIRKGN